MVRFLHRASSCTRGVSDFPVDAERNLESTAAWIEKSVLLGSDAPALRSVLKNTQEFFPTILDYIDAKRRRSNKRCLLSAAIEGKCNDVITVLLECGLDCLRTDGHFESPFLYANRMNMQSVVHQMQSAVTGMGVC